MSYLVQVSDAFFEVCSLLAGVIQAVTKGTTYILQLNYNVVATVCVVISSIISSVVGAAIYAWNILQNAVGSLKEFVHELYCFVSLVAFCVWRFFLNVYEFIDSSCLKVANFFTSCAKQVSDIYMIMKQTAVNSYEAVSELFYLILNSVYTAVASVLFFVTSVGSFSVNVVNGAWQGLGYVLSSIAYFPVYCVESLESVKRRLTSFIIHAVTDTPKETYLGIICLCLLYFVLSNTPRYFSYRGLLPFSSRMGRRRRGQRSDWHFDHGFESDFEDLYNSDSDDRVWRNNRNATADVDDSDNDASDDNNDSNDSNDSGTVDNDISDDDDDEDNSDGEDDSEDNTVVSEDSDSDASLISQTFSTESSDHEIEVQLPTPVERYSLRSRSSTPVRQPKPFNSPEDFDREMERERDKRKCVVCQDQIKSVLVLPCKHMCMCVECADHIVRSRLVGRRVCPLCRTRIQKVMNVYV